MEDVVNFLSFRKIDLIGNVGYFGGYLKRSVPPWG